MPAANPDQGELFSAPAQQAETAAAVPLRFPNAANRREAAAPAPASPPRFSSLRALAAPEADEAAGGAIHDMPENAPPRPAATTEPGLQELRGTVKRILFSRDDFRIYKVRIDKNEDVSVTMAGSVLAVEGEKATFKGEWSTFRGRPSFKARLLIKDLPSDTKGIVAWIKTGAVLKVGKATGEKIAKHWGDRAVEAVQNIDMMIEAGVERSKAEAIKFAWDNNAMQPEIIAYLGSLGLGEMTITKIFHRYGFASRQAIEKNPWQLSETIEGIGFHTADDIGLKAGHERTAPDRICAGIRYVLSEACGRDGHCGLPIDNILYLATNLLNIDRRLVEAQIWEAVDGNRYVYDEVTGLAAPVGIHRAEQSVVEHLSRLQTSISFGDKEAGEAIDAAQVELNIKLDPSQRDAALLALTNSVCIITGGPGTGKSTTQKVITHALRAFKKDIVLGAPTGRAAKRLAEVSGLAASTCHRLLQWSTEAGGFVFHAGNPFKEDWFIVDEFSMVDTNLASSFIQAIPTGAGFTIVGDVDQLPSVGAGQVLRDMITTGVIPTARLTTVHRQGKDSGIITAAHRINSGTHPMGADQAMNGFAIDEKRSEQEILAHVVDLMTNQLPALGFDPLRDVQVLAAMRKGPIGVNALNDALKTAMNPPSEDGQSVIIRNRTWTVGDRVMHTKNNYGKGVYNGEVGFVVEAGTRATEDDKMESYFKVDYSGFKASYTNKDVDEIEQCWAATVHKSQGCEFPVVILVCPSEHAFMLNKNLFYTGVTRAKTNCIVVGNDTAVRRAVSNAETTKRFTGLSTHLKTLNAAPPIDVIDEWESPSFIQVDRFA